MQQRIERAGFEIDPPAAGLADLFLDQIAVAFSAGEHREDHRSRLPRNSSRSNLLVTRLLLPLCRPYV